MAEFESKNVMLNAEQATVYSFLSDFRNFNHLIPAQIKDWEATGDKCSFKADNAGVVRLRYKTRRADLIEIEPDMDLPVAGEIVLYVKLDDRSPKTNAIVGANISIPPMFKMMVSRPLKNMVDMIAAALEKYYNG
ncbi:MAG: hypothetical protein GX259_04785 [Bacteroidales bacterium]|nr:hypothetical protein [Bacteroidales bacterium]